MSARHRVTDVADIGTIPVSHRPTALFGVFTVLGYGHLARSHRLAQEFAARVPGDTYVFGSHPDVRLDGGTAPVHEIHLPPPVLVDSPEPPEDLPGPAQLRGPVPGMSVAELSAHKSRLLLGLARHLRPRIVVIDHFPFATTAGRDAAECVATLAYLQDAMPRTLRCAGYRGVSTMTGGQGHDACARLIDRYLDLLLVYVDPRERAHFLDAHPFLRPVEGKMRFVGYVAPPPRGAVRRDAAGGRMLATFGAGMDAYRTIRLVCDAFRILAAARADLALDVVAGEGLPDGAYREIATVYGDPGRLRIARSRPVLAAHLDEYDLVISMGGYNACVELYQSRARSIVLPRMSSSRPEQIEQARKFHAYGAIDHVVDRRATSPEALARLMAATLEAPPALRQPLDLGGARAAAELLHAELRRRARAAAPRHVS